MTASISFHHFKQPHGHALAFLVGIPLPRSAWIRPLLVLARTDANAFPKDLIVTAAVLRPELQVVNPVFFVAADDLTLSKAKAFERKALENRRVISPGC